jgi:hypothetical protein
MIGASDVDIKRLATCYWHSIEFGMVYDKETDTKKAYGAGKPVTNELPQDPFIFLFPLGLWLCRSVIVIW